LRQYGSENFKLLYDEEGGFFVGFWTKFRWPLVWANVKFGECIYCLVYACFAFCLFVSLFFGDICMSSPWKPNLDQSSKVEFVIFGKVHLHGTTFKDKRASHFEGKPIS
jgi:hypothetical protein